jgi:hypothetical protein
MRCAPPVWTPPRMTRILGSAAAAAMHALVLDAVVDEQIAAASASSAPEAVEQERAPDASPVRLAA